MKKVAIIFIVVLMFASLTFAADNGTKNQALDKLNDAKDEIEDAEDALYGNETDYSLYFDRCPEVNEDWNEAEDKLAAAQESYDDAFEEYILEKYSNAYDLASSAYNNAHDVFSILHALPLKVIECEREERRQAASDSISAATSKRNEVKDSVLAKISCPEVEDKWDDAEGQYTLMNTHYTGGDYLSAKAAADNAVAYYEDAKAAADECVIPEPEPYAPEIECQVDTTCEYDEYCSDGQCLKVECECGYIGNHKCYHYDCCENTDCESGYTCELHECVEVIEEPPPALDENGGTYPCPASLGMLLLAGLVVSRNI